jgi:PIN domain nuclease of toxin-antitoxin system
MAEPTRLSVAASTLIEGSSEEIAFSAVSGWEIAIKSALGKLSDLPVGDVEAEIAQALVENLTLVTSDPLAARYGVPVLW